MNLRETLCLLLIVALTAFSLKGEASEPFSVGGLEESISGASGLPGAHELGGACPEGQVVLIDQAPNGVAASAADSSCGLCPTGAGTIADDFVMAAEATVSQVVIWGVYALGDTLPDPVDPFTVIFHEDLQGLPGSVIASQTLLPTSVTETGVIIFDFTELVFVFDLDPVELAAGTYWVELFTDTAGNSDDFFWEQAVLDEVRGRESGAFDRATPGANWIAIDPPLDYSLIVCATADDVIFSDGFESGDASAWSLTFPAP